MKLKTILLLVISISVIIPIAPANSQESPYVRFIKLMQNFHDASNGLQMEMVQSIYLIRDALSAEPEVEKIKASAISLNEKGNKFNKASIEMHQFVNKNEVVLKSVKDVVRKIEADSSAENLKKAKDFVDAFNDFANTTSQTTFAVYANEGWANSGISVNVGDIIFVDAKGKWKVSPTYEQVGWKGYICSSSRVYNINQKYPLGALLFRVRGSSNSNGSYLSDNRRAKIDTSGRLEFVINDSDRRNNEGQLNLRVIVLKGETLKNLLTIIENLKDNSKH
jgi:hypothetical protein